MRTAHGPLITQHLKEYSGLRNVALKYKRVHYTIYMLYYGERSACNDRFLQSCMYVYMCTCVHVYMCTCVHVYMCICVHVYMCTCVYVCMCTCVHVYMCACVHVYMCRPIDTCLYCCDLYRTNIRTECMYSLMLLCKQVGMTL